MRTTTSTRAMAFPAWVRASVLALALVPGLTHGQPQADLHAYWDSHCTECHGHSAEFARRFLVIKDGQLQGRHHAEDLDAFLSHHYLADDLIEPVKTMLIAQVTLAARFQAQCSRCHGPAAALARDQLVLREGVLQDRGSGRPVSDFLQGHAGLSGADVVFFTDLLERLAREVGATGKP